MVPQEQDPLPGYEQHIVRENDDDRYSVPGTQVACLGWGGTGGNGK